MTDSFIMLAFRVDYKSQLGYNVVRRGCSAVVAQVLPKHWAVGSNPITRSRLADYTAELAMKLRPDHYEK